MNQRQITEKILQKNDLKLSDIAFLICRGAWPIAVGLPEEAALEQVFDYYDAVTNEARLRKLVEYGVLVEIGKSDYLNFFGEGCTFLFCAR